MRLVLYSLVLPMAAMVACGSPSPVQDRPKPAGGGRAEQTLAGVLRAEDRRQVDDALREALGAGDVTTRAAAVLALARIGTAEARPALERALADPAPPVRAAAAFGLGILGDDAAALPLSRTAQDGDPGVRARAVQALGLLAAPDGTAAVLAALSDDVAAVREEAALAAWRLPDPSALVDALVKGAGDSEPRARFGAVYALARLGAAPFAPPSGGAVPGRLAPADVVRVRAVLRSLVSSPLAEIRMQAARGLYRPATPEEESALGSLASDTDPGVRINSARSLAYEGAPVEPHLLRLVRDREPAVGRSALEGLGTVKSPKAAQILADGIERETRGWFLEAAITSLVDAYASLGPPRLMSLALERDPRVRARVASLLGRYDDPEAASLSRAFLKDASAAVRAAAFPVVARFEPPEGPLWAETLNDPDPAVRAAVAAGVGIVWKRPDSGAAAREALWPVLESAWTRAEGDSVPNARVATLSAAVLDASDSRAKRLLEAGLASPDPVTRRASSDLWRDTYGEDRSFRVPPTADLPAEDYRTILAWAASPRAAVVTVQRPGFEPGRFVIRLLTDEAPLTCWNFWKLAKAGYYDGLSIHRVVPNFVVQDGDPRGDGIGGPGYAIRDEFTPRRYWAGTVGMATDGPDTAGSQWFITVSAQPHLDGRYSAFGLVTQNFEGVVTRLVPGDRIVRISVYEGDGSEPLPPMP